MKNRKRGEWIVIEPKGGWCSGWMRLDSNFIYHQMLAGERHVYDLFASAIEKSQSIEPGRAPSLPSTLSLSLSLFLCL